MDFGIAGVAAITVIAYAVGQAMRALGRLDRWIPTVCAALGGALGVAGLTGSILDSVSVSRNQSLM